MKAIFFLALFFKDTAFISLGIYLQGMRIFVNSTDLTGTKRNTRVNLYNCPNTNALIRLVCKELGVNRASCIIKLKVEPHQLIITQNWPLEHYPIKNGSIFILEMIDICNNGSPQFSDVLQKIEEEDFLNQEEANSSSNQTSPRKQEQQQKMEQKYAHYLQESLDKMLEAVRAGNLEKIADIMKEEPNIQDEAELAQLMAAKYKYLLNEICDSGSNALHWAIHTNQPDIVAFLLIKGSNPAVVSIDQYTPLQLAVQYRSPQIVSLLLQQPVIDINQVTQHGTALHLAVRNQDFRCLQLLLQNQVSVDIPNNEGKLPKDICSNQQISELLKKKEQMGKIVIPYIAKGEVYRVSSTTYRLKQRALLLNPFKNDFSISHLNGQIQQRIEINRMASAEYIHEKSWLMKSNINYFKIIFKDQQKGLMFGVNRSNICKRWVEHLRNAIKYTQFLLYVKPVAQIDQIVEILDDKEGNLVLHKRKIEEKPSNKSSKSILMLKEQEINVSPKKTLLKRTTGETESIKSVEDDKYRQSEIVLGSVLEVKKVHTPSSALTTSFQSKSSERMEEESNRFRKHSESRVEEVSEFTVTPAPVISYINFEVLKQLGTGAFGKVYLATFRPTGCNYAVKVLNKKKLFSKKQLKYAVGETNILKKMDSPFIIKLHFAFQTPSNLYMVLDNCSLGDLAELITIKDYLKEKTARFVIAQLILAIEYLHSHNILYRDLKPENILISQDGYIKLTDFGLSRQNSFATSFCGSPAYLSPEMLDKKGVGQSSDIYGIGCVLYEMVVGEPPYFNQDMEVLFQNIKTAKLRFPSNLSLQLKSLISKLLERDINRRIGVKDISEIKKHDFFKKLDWNLLAKKKVPVPQEMFGSVEGEQGHDELELEVNERIKLVDQDYNQSTRMINRIKNFTFVREESLKKQAPIVIPRNLEQLQQSD